jgi:hypothetical protein
MAYLVHHSIIRLLAASVSGHVQLQLRVTCLPIGNTFFDADLGAIGYSVCQQEGREHQRDCKSSALSHPESLQHHDVLLKKLRVTSTTSARSQV